MAVFIMCGGAALAGLTDITFNLVGYFWVLVTPSPALAPAHPFFTHTSPSLAPLALPPPRHALADAGVCRRRGRACPQLRFRGPFGTLAADARGSPRGCRPTEYRNAGFECCNKSFVLSQCCDCGVPHRNKTVKRLAVPGGALKGSESCACGAAEARAPLRAPFPGPGLRQGRKP